jgi:hypothetical protein
VLDEAVVRIGSTRLFTDLPEDVRAGAEKLQQAGRTVMIVSRDERVLGFIGQAAARVSILLPPALKAASTTIVTTLSVPSASAPIELIDVAPPSGSEGFAAGAEQCPG